MDERILSYPSPAKLDEEHECFACYEGVVYIGHMVESEADGDEVEVLEAVPCRRCQRSLDSR
jgi:hypothetical protein